MDKIQFKNGDPFPTTIRGTWQLSQGHQSQVTENTALNAIEDSIHLGFNTFDCADIYTGVESLLGKIRLRHKTQRLRFHTKYVPDYDQLTSLSFDYTQSIIDRSLRRLCVDQLDLVQFHWWDYSIPHYLDALEHLTRLKDCGKIKSIGVTNFSSHHLSEIAQAGFDIASIQLQSSLIDKRNLGGMSKVCHHHGIKQFGYGTLLGGFFDSKWLHQKEPDSESLDNRSLVKYKLLIDEWGGWDRFQGFLSLLSELAEKYSTSVGQIATQAVLQSKQVDAVIVGLSPVNYMSQNRNLVQRLQLDIKDLNEITSWTCPLEGDVYQLERSGKHAKIMRYNLNRQSN